MCFLGLYHTVHMLNLVLYMQVGSCGACRTRITEACCAVLLTKAGLSRAVSKFVTNMWRLLLCVFVESLAVAAVDRLVCCANR